jgi:regulator of sigma E protease
MSYLLVFLILGVVIFVHEFGHYLAMRWCGVRVLEFTIGFGPKLWSTRLKNGTIFSIRAVLFGGFTKPLSARAEALGNVADWKAYYRERGELTKELKREIRGLNFRLFFDLIDWPKDSLPKDSIEAKKFLQMVFIYMAGMIVNVLFAILILAAAYYLMGGFPTGLSRWVIWAPTSLQPLVAAAVAPTHLWLMTPSMVFDLLINFKTMMSSVAGPVGIIVVGGQIVSSETNYLDCLVATLRFVGLICGAIAGFNLIPLVPLDGGRIVEMGVRRVFGCYGTLVFQIIGFTFILLVLILIFLADGTRLYHLLVGWVTTHISSMSK